MGPQLALERFVPGAIETKTTAMAGLGEEHSDDEQILFWSERWSPAASRDSWRLARRRGKAHHHCEFVFSGPARNGSRARPMMP